MHAKRILVLFKPIRLDVLKNIVDVLFRHLECKTAASFVYTLYPIISLRPFSMHAKEFCSLQNYYVKAICDVWVKILNKSVQTFVRSRGERKL
jgi:hypothetical protein